MYPVPVRRPAVSLPASFTPSSRSDALWFTSLAATSSREDFHLQVSARAGRTNAKRSAERSFYHALTLSALQLPISNRASVVQRPLKAMFEGAANLCVLFLTLTQIVLRSRSLGIVHAVEQLEAEIQLW